MACLGDCMDEGDVSGRPISPPRSGLSDSMDHTPEREENDKPEEVSQKALQPEIEQNNGSESGLGGSKGHTPEREEGENDEHKEEESQEPLQPETEGNNGSESGLGGSKDNTPEREEGENDEHKEVSQETLQPETEGNNGSDWSSKLSEMPEITSEEENSLFYVPPQTIEGESFKKGVCPTEALEEDLLLLKSAIIGFFNGSQPSLSVVKHSLEKQWKIINCPLAIPSQPLQPQKSQPRPKVQAYRRRIRSNGVADMVQTSPDSSTHSTTEPSQPIHIPEPRLPNDPLPPLSRTTAHPFSIDPLNSFDLESQSNEESLDSDSDPKPTRSVSTLYPNPKYLIDKVTPKANGTHAVRHKKMPKKTPTTEIKDYEMKYME
ncbi:hypothetical protein NE237_002991 [Protea cynaroides]|uniref:Uncharacterized protein n=1 Tax=Protea cynaroides TaxID=273540 RepID=A0A9Q0KG46_9MAGN|nr:hypothetical protein NE237_002991 [Protea cynaroides]